MITRTLKTLAVWASLVFAALSQASFAPAATAAALVAATTLSPISIAIEAPANAQNNGNAVTTTVQNRLTGVAANVATVIRNVLFAGAVIAAIIGIGGAIMGRVDVKRGIQIGVACVLLGVAGALVGIFTGASANTATFDDNQSFTFSNSGQ